MDWTGEQLEELRRAYERIGFQEGDSWPAPPEHLTPADLLLLIDRIPDRAGRAGWIEALRPLERP